MEPLVGHLEIQNSITEQCNKLSDRGFNRMRRGRTEAIMNQVVRKQYWDTFSRRVTPVLNPKMLRSYLGKTYFKARGTAQTKTQKGWTVTFTENCKQFHRTGAHGVKGEWGDGRGPGRVLGRTTLKIRLKELAVYLEDEGKSLQDFKQGIPQ